VRQECVGDVECFAKIDSDEKMTDKTNHDVDKWIFERIAVRAVGVMCAG
jgi:hypothetical protein